MKIYNEYTYVNKMVYEPRWLFGWIISTKQFLHWCKKHNVEIQTLFSHPTEYDHIIPPSVTFVYSRQNESCDTVENYTIGVHLSFITGTLDTFQDISGETIEEAQQFVEQFTSNFRSDPSLHVMVHYK